MNYYPIIYRAFFNKATVATGAQNRCVVFKSRAPEETKNSKFLVEHIQRVIVRALCASSLPSAMLTNIK